MGTIAVATVSTRRRRSSSRTDAAIERRWGYAFILPTVAFFIAFVAYPFIRAAYLSLSRWAGYGTVEFVGFHNFVALTQDPIFWQALRTTILYTAITTVVQTALPLLLAVLLNAGWRGGVLFRTVVFLPAVVSFVVSGILWQMIYEPNFGLLNRALRAVGLGGLAQGWLANGTTALPAIMFVSLWMSLGLFMLIYFAGMQGINPNLYEAARLDGANSWQQLRYVTVPMLRPITAVVVTLNMISGLKVFDIVYTMTGGGPNHATEVLGTYLYSIAFGSRTASIPAIGYGTAVSMVVFVLAMGAVLFQNWWTRKARDERD